MALNQIGEYQFIDLRNPASPAGSPGIIRQVNEVIQRGGVRGSGIRRHGLKGQEFTMQSVVDVPNRDTGVALTGLYSALCDEEPQTLIHGGINYESYSMRYAVLDVTDFDVKNIAQSTGGIVVSTGALVLVHATWHLLPIELPPE